MVEGAGDAASVELIGWYDDFAAGAAAQARAARRGDCGKPSEAGLRLTQETASAVSQPDGESPNNLAIDYSNFKRSLKNLETQYEHLLHLPPDYPSFVHEAMTESVIQRFEVCYDALWKSTQASPH